MSAIPESSQEIRNFAKAILAAKVDPYYETGMRWFRSGAWYMDALYTMVLTLQDDDPWLAKVLESLASGTLYRGEVVAENALRWDMSKAEMGEFVKATTPEGSLLLFARMLIQREVKKRAGTEVKETTKISPSMLLVATFKVAARTLWYGIRAAIAAAKARGRKR